MSLRQAIEVIAKLAGSGAIHRYAIAGAFAAMNYIAPTLSDDLDILISIEDFESRQSGLILLAPVEKALAELGYSDRTDLGIMIEGWPVQFLPAASDLDQDALDSAIEIEIGSPGGSPLKARCLRAEHVVAIAIKVGRLKDLARVQSFLEQHAVDLFLLKQVLQRHGLMRDWRRFCVKAGIENPLAAI